MTRRSFFGRLSVGLAVAGLGIKTAVGNDAATMVPNHLMKTLMNPVEGMIVLLPIPRGQIGGRDLSYQFLDGGWQDLCVKKRIG